MRSAIHERICDVCGVSAPDEADTVCVRCGTPLPQTTPTGVYAPQPRSSRRWIETTTEPPISSFSSQQTLIGVTGLGPDAGASPSGSASSPQAMERTEVDVPLPSDASTPSPVRRSYEVGVADTQRRVASGRGRARQGGRVDRGGLADTLPPSSASPTDGGALSQVRTDPDSSLAQAMRDMDVTSPLVAEDTLPVLGQHGDHAGALDPTEEATSPPLMVDPEAGPRLSELMSSASPPDSFIDNTLDVSYRSVTPAKSGVSLGLLGLWVVAIAATIAAVLVLVLR